MHPTGIKNNKQSCVRCNAQNKDNHMEKEVKKVIALMSGTSCDSIDAGLCEVYPDLSVKLIKGINYSYPEHIKSKIFSAFRGDISIKELCQL